MPYQVRVFVSSRCYELEDLRSVVATFLEEFGLAPMLSNDNGFPQHGVLHPYVSCLKTLEDCQLVIGVIDRTYGHTFEDWGPYPQYAGKSPTHAELLHAHNLKKKTLVFVREATTTHYQSWRRAPDSFRGGPAGGLPEVLTLKMLGEIKNLKPIPWIRSFRNAAELSAALRDNLLNELYLSFQAQEREATNQAAFLLDKISELAPELRAEIERGLAPASAEKRTALEDQVEQLRGRLAVAENVAKAGIELKDEAEELRTRVADAESRLNRARVELGLAAIRDVRWLDRVRTTLMPRQSGRVPFHNDAEIALRGFHVTNFRNTRPILSEVTWSKVGYDEDGRHRGYKAALIFRGANFPPGVMWARRRIGETLPGGRNDYFWRSPSIYFGDYLEVSAGDDEDETPLSSRRSEFCIRTPDGKTTDWVPFSYRFDDQRLTAIMEASVISGEEAAADGRLDAAVESFRRAYVFADRLPHVPEARVSELRQRHEKAVEERALSKLRFRAGDRLKVVAGEHVGEAGVVDHLALGHVRAYVIAREGDEQSYFQVGDQEVEMDEVPSDETATGGREPHGRSEPETEPKGDA